LLRCQYFSQVNHAVDKGFAELGLLGFHFLHNLLHFAFVDSLLGEFVDDASYETTKGRLHLSTLPKPLKFQFSDFFSLLIAKVELPEKGAWSFAMPTHALLHKMSEGMLPRAALLSARSNSKHEYLLSCLESSRTLVFWDNMD